MDSELDMGSHRVGGEVGPFFHSSAHLDPTELPMVVWLRGDEPFFADFSLSAEEAMEILGIRRSRLTQISGRELRVGRTRIDRYVRPVFRPADVEAYLAWTRQTASHQKSSDALKEAAELLSATSQSLAGELLQRADPLPGQAIGQIATSLEHAADFHREERRERIQWQASLEQGLQETLNRRLDRLRDQLGEIAVAARGYEKLDARIAAVSESLVLFMTDIHKFHAAATEDRILFRTLLADQASSLDAVRTELSAVKDTVAKAKALSGANVKFKRRSSRRRFGSSLVKQGHDFAELRHKRPRRVRKKAAKRS